MVTIMRELFTGTSVWYNNRTTVLCVLQNKKEKVASIELPDMRDHVLYAMTSAPIGGDSISPNAAFLITGFAVHLSFTVIWFRGMSELHLVSNVIVSTCPVPLQAGSGPACGAIAIIHRHRTWLWKSLKNTGTVCPREVNDWFSCHRNQTKCLCILTLDMECNLHLRPICGYHVNPADPVVITSINQRFVVTVGDYESVHVHVPNQTLIRLYDIEKLPVTSIRRNASMMKLPPLSVDFAGKLACIRQIEWSRCKITQIRLMHGQSWRLATLDAGNQVTIWDMDETRVLRSIDMTPPPEYWSHVFMCNYIDCFLTEDLMTVSGVLTKDKFFHGRVNLHADAHDVALTANTDKVLRFDPNADGFF